MTEYQRERFPIPTPRRLGKELRLPRAPWWMIATLIGVVIATWLPLYAIYRKRSSYSEKPKIHFVQDMDLQPSYGPQAPHSLFADGRATRSPVPGTVARGNLQLDDHLYRGYRIVTSDGGEHVKFFEELPPNLVTNQSLLARGRERFEIFCSPCHDSQGTGVGIVHQRAVAAQESKWVPPTNLLTQEMRDRADGRLFQSISDGVRNMPGYKTQVGTTDRWAIVAYVRQLQQNSPVAETNSSAPTQR